MVFRAKNKTSLGRSVESFESIVGKSLTIEGNLKISQGIRIDGTLNGNIYQEDGVSATVAIAESGLVNGSIYAQHVIISGKVKGDIYSLDRVELLKNAHIEGDISYGSIGIEAGASVLGKLKRINAQDAEDAVELLINQAKQKTTT
jgi:cytoskeletal protein CcmA (bactofilin family)